MYTLKALGNFYFIHESIENVQIWNFKEATFLPCVGKETHSGNIEAVETKEKSKFPQNFFPEVSTHFINYLAFYFQLTFTMPCYHIDFLGI